MKNLLQQVTGVFTLLFMCVNTVFWSIPLYVVTTIKLLTPIKSIKSFYSKVLFKISAAWIASNNFILDLMQNIKWDVCAPDHLSKLKSYLIISNHQSWVDIIVLQRVFNHQIPFPRFFIKKQLRWLPLLGGAFWALDFPFMNRFSKEYLKKHPEKSGEDMKVTQETCRKISKSSFSLINFPEGTRFSIQKHNEQKSPFRHQLKPKAGGIAYALEAFEGNLHNLLDVTIVYPKGRLTFWSLLTGKIPNIIVRIQQINIPEDFGKKTYASDPEYRAKVQNWINEIWEQKDQVIATTPSKI